MMTILLWALAAVAFWFAPILVACTGIGGWLGGPVGAFIGGSIGWFLQAEFRG